MKYCCILHGRVFVMRSYPLGLDDLFSILAYSSSDGCYGAFFGKIRPQASEFLSLDCTRKSEERPCYQLLVTLWMISEEFSLHLCACLTLALP